MNMLPRWLSGKESACQAEDMGLIPDLGRSSGEGNGNPLQYSCHSPWGHQKVGHDLVTKQQQDKLYMLI